MRKKYLKIIVIFIGCILIMKTMRVEAFANQYSSISSIEDVIPLEAKLYVNENMNIFFQYACEFDTMQSISMSEDIGLILGNPYVIYNFSSEQDEVYYYPIIDKESNTVISIVGIIGTEFGYVFEIQTGMADILNEMNYIQNNCIFYIKNGNLYAENQSQLVNVDLGLVPETGAEEENIIENQFFNLSYEEKMTAIIDKIPEFKPYTSVAWENEEQQLNSLLGTTLTLYYPQGLYSYGMCWASSTATVINYLKSSTVTGFDVCNRLGIGYNTGGSLYDIQSGLSYYGINYDKVLASIMPWENIEENINAGYPIVLCANGVSGQYLLGHAAVIHGYSGSGSNRVINVWNPAGGSGGSGESVIIKYNNVSACFTINGVVYGWDHTLSKKYNG